MTTYVHTNVTDTFWYANTWYVLSANDTFLIHYCTWEVWRGKIMMNCWWNKWWRKFWEVRKMAGQIVCILSKFSLISHVQYMYTYVCTQICSYGTAQMQLQSWAWVSSKTLEGLLKVTCYKLCVCSRFSTLLSLASITHFSICYWLVTTFIVRFSSQCAYSKKGHVTVRSFTRICALVI